MEPIAGSQPDWRSLIREDDLVVHGRQIAKGLPQMASREDVEDARKRVDSWARTQASMAVIQTRHIDGQRMTGELQKINDLREQLPNWQQKVLDAEKAVEDVRSDGIYEEPKKPPIRLFLFGGLMLGTLFGLVGATTIASVLRSIWRPDVADPETFYMAWGTIIGLLIGWVVGTITILTREFAVGAGRFARWAPFFFGLSIAVGLSGYRFLQPSEADPSVIVVRISGIAVVLLFLELALLLAIEALNHVALHAWEQYTKAQDSYATWAAREKAALSVFQRCGTVFEEAKKRLTKAYEEVEVLRQVETNFQDAQAHKLALETFAAQAALRGFELGWTERRAGS